MLQKVQLWELLAALEGAQVSLRTILQGVQEGEEAMSRFCLFFHE